MKLATPFLGKFTAWWRSLFSNNDSVGLEVGAITAHFNLLAQARKLAEMGLPAFHSKNLTSIELEVVRYIDNAREQKQRQTLTELERIDADIAQTQAHPYEVKSGLVAGDFERRALLIFNEQNAWLDKLGSAAARRLSELDNFRRKNAIERDAIYPDASALFFRYAILVLLITFEGLFNASFFAEGLTTGLLGGFLYAVVLAALNVVTAFVMGKTAVRWAFHVKAVPKFMGLLALALTLAFTVTMALCIGHLRTVILAGSVAPTQDAWVALISAPFGLHDMMAWLLFMVTIGFGVAAMVDGLLVDDVYPGYGDVSRRAKLAVEEFEDEFEEVRATLEDAKQDNIDALDEEIVQANQRAQQLKQLIDQKKAIYHSWLTFLNESEVTLYAVLRMFRSENTRHRSDAMRPAYFDTLPTLRRIDIPKPDMTEQQNSLNDLADKAKSLEAGLNARRAKVYQLFDQHIQQLNYIKQAQAKFTGGML
jgi:hypothetical protein